MMKIPLLFQIQLILLAIIYNDAFMSGPKSARATIPRPKTTLVASNSGDETTASKDDVNVHVEANGRKSGISTLDNTRNESIMNCEVIRDENDINNSVVEFVENIETKLDKVTSKEDLLTKFTSSISSTLSIAKSDDLMETIGGDIINKVNSSQHYFELSPPLSFSKYLTMQVHTKWR